MKYNITFSPLPLPRRHNPTLLQQIIRRTTSHDNELLAEMDLHVFTEAGGVVVADRFGVAEGFEDGVGLEDFVLGGGC